MEPIAIAYSALFTYKNDEQEIVSGVHDVEDMPKDAEGWLKTQETFMENLGTSSWLKEHAQRKDEPVDCTVMSYTVLPVYRKSRHV